MKGMDETTTGDCERPAREAAADKMASASPAAAMPERHCAGGHVCCTEHQGYADCKGLPSHRSQLQLPLNIIFPNAPAVKREAEEDWTRRVYRRAYRRSYYHYY